MLKLHVFGVGDGDCIVLELPNGQFGLIDSFMKPGTDTPAALPLLQGRRLAFCCLTHPHYDHLAGMLRTLNASDVRVDNFWCALSDIDDVLPELNWACVYDGDTSLGTRRRTREVAELQELFQWVWHQPAGFEELIVDVQCRTISGVEFLLVGPDPIRWKRYRRGLAAQRAAGHMLKRKYANTISVALLIRYHSHAIWLLGDLTRAPMRLLPKRLQNRLPAGSDCDVKASIYKVSHHGAQDGWFPEVGETLTRCDPEDVIVVSASGSTRHPHPSVWKYWKGTGKRVYGTWTEDERAGGPRLGGSVSDLVDQIAPPEHKRKARDLIIAIPKDGPAEVIPQDT